MKMFKISNQTREELRADLDFHIEQHTDSGVSMLYAGDELVALLVLFRDGVGHVFQTVEELVGAEAGEVKGPRIS